MTRPDAVLLVSFGGPEGPDDVVPFLRNVTRGRGIPDERLVEVGMHYLHFDGVSPINAQNRALVTALRDELARHGPDLPVYWGNRNWTPFLADTMREMRDDGVRRAVVVTTSAYSSYSGCRQYREDLATARGEAGAESLDLVKVGPYANHPHFLACFVSATMAALDELPDAARETARLLFSTHSLPEAAAATSGPAGGAYVAQHEAVMHAVAAEVEALTGTSRPYELVFQSRSGPPEQAWLEPDVDDRLEELAAEGERAVVVVPIGFVSDHMEVVWDLDTQARATAERVGLELVRAATPGTHPMFVAMLRDLVAEIVDEVPLTGRPRALGRPAWPDRCPAGCCPNPRGPRPACCGED